MGPAYEDAPAPPARPLALGEPRPGLRLWVAHPAPLPVPPAPVLVTPSLGFLACEQGSIAQPQLVRGAWPATCVPEPQFPHL